MSELISKEKLLITNNRDRQDYKIQVLQLQRDEPTLPLIQKQSQIQKQNPVELNERLKKIQGNLKLLQKKYRQNLKDGFQNKIKAYRLEAVFERKMMKNAIKQIQKEQEAVQIKKKMVASQQKSALFNARIQAMKVDRYERSKQLRQMKRRERVSFSISLHENKYEMQALAKKSHDQILEQEQNINKKKDYFTYIRKSNQRKQQTLQKQQLLQKIFHNTQKLRQAKQTLSAMQYNHSQQDRSKIFLTI